REGAIARGAEQPATAHVSQPAPPAESAPAAAAPPAPRPAPGSTRSSSPGPVASGSTHVVTRGETLSQIAAATAGASSNTPQTRSWMVAIYQANPSAFEKNMNLLHSGAVLRIPEASEAAAISPSEASGEIRRQYAAWRSGSAAAPETGTEPGRL